jgi:hypothetical protein
MGFNITAFTAAPFTHYDFSIKAHWTSTSSFSGTTFENVPTTIFSDPTFTLTQNGAYQLLLGLHTPIVWDGSSNLLLEFCYNNTTPASLPPFGSAASVGASTISGVALSTTLFNTQNVCALTTGTALTVRPSLLLRYAALPATYTPTYGLFTDAAATIAYIGSGPTTVYARPSSNINYVASTRVGVCAGRDTIAVTVTGQPTSLANRSGATDSTLWSQNADTVLLRNAECELIAKVMKAGASPFAATAAGHVFIDSAIRSFNAQPYVQRHYDLSSTTGTTGSAQLTLYATQAEFDAYNSFVSSSGLSLPLLPTSGTDNGNIRITQYSGASATRLPGSYSPGAATLITPSASWNAAMNWWELSFPVNGFSGFFIHTGTNGPLQVQPRNSDAFSLHAFPNPMKQQLQVRVEGQVSASAQLSLLDAAGRVVWQQPMTGTVAAIYVGQLPAGVYLLQYQDGQRVRNLKVVQQ